jgi:peptidyl-prolyl cis-trans isomerase A (cyclophilin A)
MNRREVIALPLLQLIAARAFGATTDVIRTRVKTALGDFVIAVSVNTAPITVANYLAYVDGRFLDSGSVYRIVTLENQPPETKHKIEVVQWGMNLPDDKPAPFKPIVHESTKETGLKHLDGTVSMARNGPGTATAEFFICIGVQPELDFGGRRNPDGQGFAAFGQVVEGMETVRAIHRRGEPKQYLKNPIPIASVRRNE